MKNSTEDCEKNLNKPMKIKIMVQGEIGAYWSERLANMQITIERRQNRKPISVLTGLLDSHADLRSVLNLLYDLHLSILSVENIDTSPN
jgi:translation initiation factor 1 (eIF-1/SUI1)